MKFKKYLSEENYSYKIVKKGEVFKVVVVSTLEEMGTYPTLELAQLAIKRLPRSTDIRRESIEIPIEVGDTILGGRFKNKRIQVKNIEYNERGEPLINGKPLMKYRLIQGEEENEV